MSDTAALPNASPILMLENVTYQYEGTKNKVLKGIDASFEGGKVYTIVGKSGAGKSTLLSLLSGLDLCTNGKISYAGADLRSLDRDVYRSRGVGVVFQAYNLINNAKAVENIVLSMNISKSKVKDKKRHAYELLAGMGIDRETADRPVLKLSGGEQQRVGIARALSHSPAILIADEPTGNLDEGTEGEVLDILQRLAHEEGRCVIIVTHSREVTSIADVIYQIVGGRLVRVE
ncbi:MAG: ATP-binding cassette domain-containing protein [Coriobacteriales bacterium]|jgi:putative ABC transport system ATP-binding protein|nr:ATP-binding cassette domain-containing protein [Coriobacteriales bacterium]